MNIFAETENEQTINKKHNHLTKIVNIMMLKMKRRTNKGQVMLLATLLLGTATSCFDDSYDLKKDIDM